MHLNSEDLIVLIQKLIIILSQKAMLDVAITCAFIFQVEHALYSPKQSKIIIVDDKSDKSSLLSDFDYHFSLLLSLHYTTIINVIMKIFLPTGFLNKKLLIVCLL